MIKKILGIKSPSAEAAKKGQKIINDFTAGIAAGMESRHVNCLCVMPPVVMSYRPPSRRELTLEVMQLQMRRHHTRPWQFIKRFKIQVEIDHIIMAARLLGYFQTPKI